MTSDSGYGDAAAGRLVAAAREGAGLSIEDVAAATRIRVAIIRSIEQGDYAAAGGDFYARAHLKSIAKAVGADPDAILREYDRGKSQEQERSLETVPVVGVTSSPQFEPEKDVTAARRPASRWAAAAAVVVLILAAVVGVRWMTNDGDGPSQAGPGPSPTETTEPSPDPKPSDEPDQPTGTTPSTSATTQSGVHLVVTADVARSWILVSRADGSEAFQGVVETGQSMDFQDPTKLTVRFGYGLGVTVSINDRELGRPCTDDVCTVEYTPQAGLN